MSQSMTNLVEQVGRLNVLSWLTICYEGHDIELGILFAVLQRWSKLNDKNHM